MIKVGDAYKSNQTGYKFTVKSIHGLSVKLTYTSETGFGFTTSVFSNGDHDILPGFSKLN